MKSAAVKPAHRESVIPLNMRKKSLFPVPEEKEDHLKEWMAKNWRDYRRITILPSSLENQLTLVASIVEQLKGKSPSLQIHFRPDGSIIPIEEIMR